MSKVKIAKEGPSRLDLCICDDQVNQNKRSRKIKEVLLASLSLVVVELFKYMSTKTT